MSFLLRPHLLGLLRPWCSSKPHQYSLRSLSKLSYNKTSVCWPTITGNVKPQTFGCAKHSCQKHLLPATVSKLSVFSSGFHTTPSHSFYEDKETTSIAVWQNLRQLRASPMPALSLGLAGLIPFIAAPAYMISQGCYMPDVAFSQLAYGASILSFLGGIRWGFVLPEDSIVKPNWFNLGYSISPSLLAWVALLAPPTVGITTVMGGVAFSAYMDMTMYGYPSWFKGLRFLLSFFAILSLWSTFMCMLVLKPREQESTKMTVTDPKNEVSQKES